MRPHSNHVEEIVEFHLQEFEAYYGKKGIFCLQEETFARAHKLKGLSCNIGTKEFVAIFETIESNTNRSPELTCLKGDRGGVRADPEGGPAICRDPKEPVTSAVNDGATDIPALLEAIG